MGVVKLHFNVAIYYGCLETSDLENSHLENSPVKWDYNPLTLFKCKKIDSEFYCRGNANPSVLVSFCFTGVLTACSSWVRNRLLYFSFANASLCSKSSRNVIGNKHTKEPTRISPSKQRNLWNPNSTVGSKQSPIAQGNFTNCDSCNYILRLLRTNMHYFKKKPIWISPPKRRKPPNPLISQWVPNISPRSKKFHQIVTLNLVTNWSIESKNYMGYMQVTGHCYSITETK